jgi:hypothetical protein
MDGRIGWRGWRRKVDIVLKKLELKSKQKPRETEVGLSNRFGVEESMDGRWQGGQATSGQYCGWRKGEKKTRKKRTKTRKARRSRG